MAVLLVERPGYALIEALDRHLGLLRNMSHDGVNHLALVVSFLALHNILGGHSSFRQINVSCQSCQSPCSSCSVSTAQPTLLFVHTENHNDLIATNSDELLDTSDTSSRKFGQQDHAVDVVVLEKLDIGTHLGDLEWG